MIKEYFSLLINMENLISLLIMNIATSEVTVISKEISWDVDGFSVLARIQKKLRLWSMRMATALFTFLIPEIFCI